MAAPSLKVEIETSRQVLHRTRGVGGPITRLVSPSDFGELIKPFVFLDRFDVDPVSRADLPALLKRGYHPHSGIATITTLLAGEIYYEDTTGRAGTLPAGGVEYMQAGGGVWHTGSAVGSERARGFQLWVALPPEMENTKAKSTYLACDEVPSEGPVRVILGSYGNARSRISLNSSMNYLHVRLNNGERWAYQPPKDHDIAWVAVHEGKLRTDYAEIGKEIAVFEEGAGAIEFVAEGRTDFVLGSAAKHRYPLVLGYYSVHTNDDALNSGATEIERIGRELKLSSPLLGLN